MTTDEVGPAWLDVQPSYEWHDARLGGTALQRRTGASDPKYVWDPGLGDHRQADLAFGLDIIDARGEAPFVVITEGAKAASAVMRAGFDAVGLVSASTVPSEHVIAGLAGRTIVLWPDNDGPGRALMGRVGRMLDPESEAIHVVRWDDAPEHGDAADGGPELIAELVAAAMARVPVGGRAWRDIAGQWPNPETAAIHSGTLDAPAAGRNPEDDDDRPWPRPRSDVDPSSAMVDAWEIDNVLRRGRLMIVAGPEGLGKSRVRTELAIRKATGHGALFNHYRIPEPGRVLSFEVENGDEEDTRREEETLARLGLARANLTEYSAVSLEGLSLTDPHDQAYIRTSIERGVPAVVMFDTASSMIGDEWGTELKAAIRFLRGLARQFRCAIILFVHLVKPAKVAAGSKSRGKPAPGAQHGTSLADVMGQWTRQADTVAMMADAGAGRVLWTVRKRAPHSQLVLLAEGGTFDVIQVVAGEDLGVSTMERIHGCIATGQADVAAIATYLDMSERTVWRHVSKLREAGRVAPDAPLRVSVALSSAVSPSVSRPVSVNGAHPSHVVSDMSGGPTDIVSRPVGGRGDDMSVSVEEDAPDDVPPAEDLLTHADDPEPEDVDDAIAAAFPWPTEASA